MCCIILINGVKGALRSLGELLSFFLVLVNWRMEKFSMISQKHYFFYYFFFYKGN